MDVKDYAARFTAASRALAGEISGKDLEKFPREGDEKYQQRQQRAWYVNYLLPACQRFVGYIAKRSPQRDTQGIDYLEQFEQDCDGCNNSLEYWMQSFMVQAKARGTMLALVDMTRTLPATREEQLLQRAIPYLSAIRPEQVSEFRTDARGRLSYIKWEESAWDGDKQVQVVKEWTDTTWTVTKGDTVEHEEHGLGYCPVLAFTETDVFPSIGPFVQVADIALRLFNSHSELDALLRDQTFAILAYQIPETMSPQRFDGLNVTLSTDNMLKYYGANPPSYVAPPAHVVQSYRDTIQDLKADIDTITMNVEEPRHQESGLALTMRFQALNSALTGFSRRMEDFERKIWDVVCAWLQMENVVNVTWSKDYNLADLPAELAMLQQAQATAMPDGYVRAKMKQIVQLDLGTLEKEELADIMQEIALAEHQEPPSA